MRNRTFLISLIIALIIVQQTHAAGMCEYTFKGEDTNTIIITFEKLQQCEALVKDQESLVKEQDKRIELMGTVNTKLNQALDAQEKANEVLKQIIALKDQQAEMKDQQCREEMKKAKSGFFRDAGIFAIGAGVGILVMKILGLLAL